MWPSADSLGLLPLREYGVWPRANGLGLLRLRACGVWPRADSLGLLPLRASGVLTGLGPVPPPPSPRPGWDKRLNITPAEVEYVSDQRARAPSTHQTMMKLCPCVFGFQLESGLAVWFTTPHLGDPSTATNR